MNVIVLLTLPRLLKNHMNSNNSTFQLQLLCDSGKQLLRLEFSHLEIGIMKPTSLDTKKKNKVTNLEVICQLFSVILIVT